MPGNSTGEYVDQQSEATSANPFTTLVEIAPKRNLLFPKSLEGRRLRRSLGC
jgi:hypothetical protein